MIWAGLVLVLIGVLTLCAWRLGGKLLALRDELDALQRLLEALEARAEELVEVSERARPAILQPIDDVRAAHRARRRLVDQVKDERRAARIARGKLLTTADPMAFAHLTQRK